MWSINFIGFTYSIDQDLLLKIKRIEYQNTFATEFPLLQLSVHILYFSYHSRTKMPNSTQQSLGKLKNVKTSESKARDEKGLEVHRIHSAAEEGCVQVVKKLVERKVNVNLPAKNNLNMT